MSTNYYELLKHPNWQKKRLQILEAANFECTSCGSKDKTLHIHHKYYEKGLKPWEYPEQCLVCLCEDCHARYQEQKERLNFVIKFLDFADTEQLIGFAKGLISRETLHWEIDLNSWEEAHGLALCWDVNVKRIISSVEKEKIDGYKLEYFKKTRHLDGK